MSARSPKLLLALICVVAGYVCASLWPFHPWRWDPPRVVTNQVDEWPDGGRSFPGPGLIASQSGPPVLAYAKSDEPIFFEIVVRSTTADQYGPARILTISPDPFSRNLTVGQEGPDLVLRARVGDVGRSPQLPDGASEFRVPDVFKRSDWIDLTIELAPRHFRVWTNGDLRIDETAGEHPLESWDESFPLTIGNEFSGDRPWLGVVRRAEASTPLHHSDLLSPELLVVSPRDYWYNGISASELAPFRTWVPYDFVLNLFGYIPVGLILGLYAGLATKRTRALWGLAASIMVFSGTMEYLQFGLISRHPSTTDLILNTLGGLAGLLLSIRVGNRLGWLRKASHA